MQLADLNLTPKRDEVLQKLEQGSVWVSGPTGSGRSSLVRTLEREVPSVRVEPPDLMQVDTPVHALAQTALDAAGVAIAFDSTKTLAERAKELATRAASAGKALVVHLPASWMFASLGDTAEEQRRRGEGLQLIQGWSHGKLVLFTGSLADDDAIARLFPLERSVRLERIGVHPEALEDPAWGSYLEAAKSVRNALGSSSAISPVLVRLAVGVVGLGAGNASRVVERLRAVRNNWSLTALVEGLAKQLISRPELHSGLRAVAQARFPLPVAKAVELAGLSAQDAPLLTQCLGYGDTKLRLADPVRIALQSIDSTGVSHAKLAVHYASLDGATSPLQLSGGTLHAWLEKAHHLAHTQVPIGQRWEDLEVPSKYMMWDRARSLSQTFKRYEEAAALYDKSLMQYGDDDYAWHYLGFNLEKSRTKLPRALDAYKQAVAPTWSGVSNPGARNPWWNARLVSFLIAHGKTNDALAAWNVALDSIDPDRARVAQNSWLARQMHRWVVASWLDAGEVGHARAAFDEIPDALVDAEPHLKQLRWRLEDAEEAVLLAESIYPASVPPDSRWKDPQVPPGGVLKSWTPGRVVSADKDGVVLMLAAIENGRPIKKVVRSFVPAKKWLKVGWGKPSEASGFVEIHVAASGERILPVTAQLPPWEL
ncbi:MAG: tetratricopeptide repeat protein [Archangium sp.]